MFPSCHLRFMRYPTMSFLSSPTERFSALLKPHFRPAAEDLATGPQTIPSLSLSLQSSFAAPAAVVASATALFHFFLL